MFRQDDCILLTKVDDIVNISCEESELIVGIEVYNNNNSSNINFDEYIKIPKYAVLMSEDKLDIMVLDKVENIDNELMQLVYTSSKYIKLNEAGKQYYKMSCMTLNNNEIDEDWVDISKFIGKYCE